MKIMIFGKNTLLPYLLNRRINRLDYVVCSHFDTDHCKGLIYIMENIKIKHLIISKQPKNCNNFEEFLEIAKIKNINIIIVNKGSSINIEKDLYLDILWPDSKNFISENSLNNNSIVCKLNYKNFSCVFTGDIEEIAEREILNIYKNNTEILKSTILKVAHHGSKSSSTEEFLNAVKPKIALIRSRRKEQFWSSKY